MVRSAAELGERQSSGYAVLALAVVAVYIGGLAWAVDRLSYHTWGGLLIAPVLIAAAVPVGRRVARMEGDPWMARLILWALVLKLAAALARYAVAFQVYGGTADASQYADHGARLAEWYRQGIFTVDVGRGIVGTGFMRVLTGLVFTVTGTTKLGGFLVFSWFGFWGLYFFYRAFRVGIPDGDHRRYALLVFFLPSLLFWPSSIGKESWMLLGLGLCAYGAAKVLTRGRGGYALLSLGLLTTGVVRPHMSALVCASLLVGYLLRRSSGPASAFAPMTRTVGMVVILGVSLVVLQQAERYFGGGGDEQAAGNGRAETTEEGQEPQGRFEPVEQALDKAENSTEEGGSSFEAKRVTSPLQVPAAAVSVMFRPFPFEAHNVQAFVASLEGAGLLLLFTLAAPRLLHGARELFRRPYVMFASVYSLLFIVAFSTFGNFGILSRQRVQLFPLVFILLALPWKPPPPGRWRALN